MPLNIETGRFKNLKLEDRLCTLCNLQAVESEIHFLFECHCYDNLRRNFLERINISHPNFNDLPNENRLCILFEKYHRIFSKFILDCFNVRKGKLFNS